MHNREHEAELVEKVIFGTSMAMETNGPKTGETRHKHMIHHK